MRPLTFISGTMLTALVAAGAAMAAPGPPPKLNEKQLHARTCGQGKLVIDVHHKVVNDVDSGTKGNYWARDEYTRKLRVWRTGAGVYCAIVNYDGTFTTLAGPSPGGTTTIPAGITGTFKGGYRMDFTARLRARPGVKTRGSLGTFDYRCDTAGNCPGSRYWVSVFFTKVTGDEFDWWGWIYKAGRNGTWLNAIDGVKGDIVGSKKPEPPDPKPKPKPKK